MSVQHLLGKWDQKVPPDKGAAPGPTPGSGMNGRVMGGHREVQSCTESQGHTSLWKARGVLMGFQLSRITRVRGRPTGILGAQQTEKAVLRLRVRWPPIRRPTRKFAALPSDLGVKESQ